jgi:Spy/CpxP family protein refolding chaperone
MHALPIFFGVLGGLAIGRAIRRRRWRRMHGHGFGFGCHGHGHGHHGWHHGWHRGWGGGRRLFWLYRELNLDPQQQEEVKSLFLKLRTTFGAATFGAMRDLNTLFDVATAEPFDRARLAELAARHTDAHAQAARDMADAIARLHEILRPEQREKLRSFLGASSPAGAPGANPYR